MLAEEADCVDYTHLFLLLLLLLLVVVVVAAFGFLIVFSSLVFGWLFYR